MTVYNGIKHFHAGVFNPNRCVADFISPYDQLVLYERFFNWEIASCNYIARNTPHTAAFLRRWAEYGYQKLAAWSSWDNGALQTHFLHVGDISERSVRLISIPLHRLSSTMCLQ